MKKVMFIFLLASCAPTEKLLQTKSKSDVVKIEEKRFSKKQLPPPREYKVYALVAFVAVGIMLE